MMPEMKIAFKFQELGVGLATTLSLDRAIMAPSLKTANSTISRVGKYLQDAHHVLNTANKQVRSFECITADT